METIRAALSLARKDLISWFRTPVHILVCFVPILVIMLIFSLVLGGGQTMPVAVVLDNPDDLMSQQFADTVRDIGTAHFSWSEVVTTDREQAEVIWSLKTGTKMRRYFQNAKIQTKGVLAS